VGKNILDFLGAGLLGAISSFFICASSTSIEMGESYEITWGNALGLGFISFGDFLLSEGDPLSDSFNASILCSWWPFRIRRSSRTISNIEG
jgi:hypothetical protein